MMTMTGVVSTLGSVVAETSVDKAAVVGPIPSLTDIYTNVLNNTPEFSRSWLSLKIVGNFEATKPSKQGLQQTAVPCRASIRGSGSCLFKQVK